MQCRISLLLGRPPSEVRALPASDLALLTAYWHEEPWGPFRDNVHAGLIAAAVLNSGHRKLRRQATWKDFWLRPRESEQRERRGSLLASLRLMATQKRARKAPAKPAPESPA